MTMFQALSVLAVATLLSVNAFQPSKLSRYPHTRITNRHTQVHMAVDMLPDPHMVAHASQWVDLAYRGLADAAAVTPEVAQKCANFGEPGWAPFCFLNGNPVFAAFDSFQLFIQNSIVNLHASLENAGFEKSYGLSIILFTCIVRAIILPVTFKQLESTQRTQALQPAIAEIKEKYPDDKNLQNQMVALLYQETEVNPLAGCLPALLQTPVFIALYRSFTNLATTTELNEPFLWLPSLEGPTFGVRSQEWITSNWHDFTPSMGWHDTLLYLSMPVLLMVAQAISLRILTPPSDDPAMQQSQRILKYLPVLLGYFALSVPAALDVYWITNSFLSTASSVGIKAYFKSNPVKGFEIDIDKLANSQNSAYMNPTWGYSSKAQMIEEAKSQSKPVRRSKIPADFA